jgi:hypothetical protein
MFVPLHCAMCFERGLELSHRRVSIEDEAKTLMNAAMQPQDLVTVPSICEQF